MGAAPSARASKRTGDIEVATPKACGWVSGLYTVDSVDGKHDGMIEGLFSLAENYASESMEVLLACSDGDELPPGDRGNLALLIAAQEQRVPSALTAMRTMMIINGTAFAAVELANLTGPARRRRIGRESYEALVDGRVELAPSPEAVLEFALDAMAQTARLIYSLPWTLLKAKSADQGFVSSD